MRYLFKHVLMRDAVYSMQMRRHLRQMHQSAAKSIEETYANDLGPHYADLAYHYGRAEMTERERHYAILAGEKAAAEFANEQAITYFNRALELISDGQPVERWALLLAREQVYDLLGARETQAYDLTVLQELAEALGDDNRQAEIALRQANYARQTSDYPAAIEAAKEAIRLAQTNQALFLEARGLLCWGSALYGQGNFIAAGTQLRRALDLVHSALSSSEEIGPEQHKLKADVLSNLGMVLWREGKQADTLSCFEQALEVFEQLGDRRGLGGMHCNIGIILSHQGDFSQARDYLEQALGIWHKIGDRRGQAVALGNLGAISIDRCDYDEAEVYLKQALSIYQEIGERRSACAMLNNLGKVFRVQGSYDQARACLKQALDISQQIGDRRGHAVAVEHLGSVHSYLGNYDQALVHLEQALSTYREIGDRRSQGLVLGSISLLFHHLGKVKDAQDYGEQTLRLAQEVGDRRNEGYALNCLGHILVSQGRLLEAADAYQNALDTRREIGQRNLTAESLAGLARVALARDEPVQAQVYVEEILAHLETGTLDGTEEPFRIYLTCYQVLAASDAPRARDILSQAYHLLQDRAGRILDEATRHSFLENVAAHREIVSLWQAMNEDER